MRVGRLAAVAVFGLAITAGGATPLRAARTAGVVVLQAGRASGSLRPGDRLLAWDNDGVSGFLDDACAWLWVEAERGPRGPLRVTAQRSGRELRATLAQDDSSVLAGPPLPAGLHERVLRSLEEPPPKAGVAGLAGAVGDAAGPPGELWLRLMLARRWLDRGEPAAAVQLLDGAATDSAGTPHATLLLLELRARALLRAGRIAEASTAVDRALELVRTLDDAALFSARLHLVRGLMLKAAGSLHQAEAELQRARRVAGRLASGSLLEAEVLDRLGKVRFELGGRRAGLDLVRRGMAIFERAAPGSVALAESLNNLGGLEVEAGQLDAGRQHLERSRAIRERLPGQPGLYKVLYNLAGIAYLERRLEDAGALLDRAGAILERREPESAHMAQLLDVRMIVAEQRGALAEAERYGLRALELHHKLDPSSLETVACLINLGTVARSQEDLELAEKRYREALAIARRVAPDGVEVPHVLGDLAELALERGRHAEALTISREALKRLEALGAAPSTLAQVHQNLAAALLGVGQLDEAERECRTALALRRRQLPGSRDEAESLVGLGDIEDVRGRREAAARNFRRAVAILREVAPGTVHLAEALHRQTVLLERHGDTDGAIRTLREAIDALEDQVGRLGGTETVRSAFRQRYDGWYRELARLLAGAGRPADAFHVLERSRARSLLAMLAGRDLVLGRGEAARKLERRRRLLARRYDAVLAALAAAPAARRAALRGKLAALRRQQDELWEEMRTAAPRLAALRRPRPVDAASAARLLGEDEAVLTFSTGPTRSLLLVLTPDGTVSSHLLRVGSNELERQIGLLRGLILQNPAAAGRGPALETACATLGETLLGPARDRLRGRRALIVLPDGPLYLLPFACLRLGEAEPYLGERYALSVAASMTVLEGLRRTPPVARAPRKLLAVACPDPRSVASLASVRGVEPLGAIPGTVDEVHCIARIWGRQARILQGPDATEERLRALLPGTSLLHLATHAVVDAQRPLDSAIALEPDPGDASCNGLLQAWEVMEDLRLPGGLVTLSGCETALGRRLAGEGLVGLARAFEYAGARAVLASLWRVDDRATARLMERFYRHLAAGFPAAEALHRARNDLLHTRTPNGPLHTLAALLGLTPSHPTEPDDPAVWAAFQLHGDPTATFPRHPGPFATD